MATRDFDFDNYPVRRYYKPYKMVVEFTSKYSRALIISVGNPDNKKAYVVGETYDLPGSTDSIYIDVPMTKRARILSRLKDFHG